LEWVKLRTDETGMALTILPPFNEEAARRVEIIPEPAELTAGIYDVGKIEVSAGATETADTAVLVPSPTGTDGAYRLCFRQLRY
jgi:hypothetical protein